ncbi:uncharacterized protein BO96DRAFT_352336 [Aspergillus niger CBS 101883]|uniref:Uncharacterized protein n=3 Tax=Aspergillus niger TaxID=5061 RepID=A2QK50_ASPNC|nr:uncharacterized protein BO96DRAFT_352336 [Aspergillus niger CBS 101883]XP_059600705.1 hypothetical protein An04g09370 [Aspergillus niger]PYH50550.1 hypothetical protein BO96DRAFT_352336 [Aspergillus niger CBS 101883]RDH14166.1 hypothetical protein M747DRAFT_319758 [Aspergillus niger ATCC 13496]CAK39022.1 hypothetical protein An04g09370 [Aspergillus niger]
MVESSPACKVDAYVQISWRCVGRWWFFASGGFCHWATRANVRMSKASQVFALLSQYASRYALHRYSEATRMALNQIPKKRGEVTGAFQARARVIWVAQYYPVHPATSRLVRHKMSVRNVEALETHDFSG